jgi:hypothetical protein
MVSQKYCCQTFPEVFSGFSIDKNQPARSISTGTIAHRLFTALSHWVIARITQTPYSQWRSLLVDRLVVLVEGDRHV